MTMRDLLVRGLLAGLLASVLAFGFARMFGEPSVNAAIALEDSLYAQNGEPSEPEIVSRSIQSTLGLGTGLAVLSVAFGGLFAIAFAFAYGRIGNLGVRGTALFVVLVGFGALYVVPFLKYPPNPPAIGEAETIAQRTALYFGMVLLSLVATAGAIVLQRRLAETRSNWDATLIASACFLVIITVAYLAMPEVNEVPDAFPAVVLWKFRVASLGMQLVLWLSIGIAFGALTERATQPSARALAPAER